MKKGELESIFKDSYNKLNKAQMQAVDTIDGPVMVVAGPGTGKTQVLALRIANILNKTDSGAEGVLCLTFTNSGVHAMRQRLLQYIGSDASKVRIATFHGFALGYIENNFEILDFDTMPELLDGSKAIILADEILENNDWEYLRPRGNSAQYFYDIRSLITLLKRENISPDQFLKDINKEIEDLKLDPSSISSRGESKGEIKKEVVKKIESLARTREVVKFYEIYEQEKKIKGFIDYDDALHLLVRLVKESEDVASDIRENFHYILVDEHQDSSGVQNEFLSAVWKDTEKPNIFVVGDDRQLIYGFGGANISYFENFKTEFGKASLIQLIENYRSTQSVLDLADSLLQSSIVKDKLNSNTSVGDKINIYEAPYQRDEILLAGIEIKKQIVNGMNPNECAILVPKNAQVRSAVAVLSDMGISVASGDNQDLFSSPEARIMITVLRILYNPNDSTSIGELLLSPYSMTPPLDAHKFIKNTYSNNLNLESLLNNDNNGNLFSSENPISNLGKDLNDWLTYSTMHTVYETVQYVGEKLLLDNVKDHDALVVRAEVIRTLLHLAIALFERNKKVSLIDFINYLERLENYNEHVPIAVFGKNDGVKVLTLHGSKGLEFEFVWVAHMDEKSLFSSKRRAFTLPSKIEELEEIKNDEVVKRQVYVAITRAKKYANISYAKESYSGGDLELAHIFNELDQSLYKSIGISESEKILLSYGAKEIVIKNNISNIRVDINELTKIVAGEYEKKKISVTLLNNFFECPWKWYFRNLLQLPEVKGASLAFGSVVHECIEKILKNNKSITKKYITEIVAESLARNNVVDKNDVRRMSNEAINLLEKWVDKRLNNINKDHESERSVSYKDPEFPHLTMYGKVDLVERVTKNELRVTDFKTGSVKTKSMIEKEDEEGRLSSFTRQLAMYSYLIHGVEGGSRVVESQLEFLEVDPINKDAIYNTNITDEQIDLLKKDIADYDELLRTGGWVERECHFQSYGSNKECPNCKRALIYK